MKLFGMSLDKTKYEKIQDDTLEVYYSRLLVGGQGKECEFIQKAYENLREKAQPTPKGLLEAQ